MRPGDGYLEISDGRNSIGDSPYADILCTRAHAAVVATSRTQSFETGSNCAQLTTFATAKFAFSGVHVLQRFTGSNKVRRGEL